MNGEPGANFLLKSALVQLPCSPVKPMKHADDTFVCAPEQVGHRAGNPAIGQGIQPSFPSVEMVGVTYGSTNQREARASWPNPTPNDQGEILLPPWLKGGSQTDMRDYALADGARVIGRESLLGGAVAILLMPHTAVVTAYEDADTLTRPEATNVHLQSADNGVRYNSDTLVLHRAIDQFARELLVSLVNELGHRAKWSAWAGRACNNPLNKHRLVVVRLDRDLALIPRHALGLALPVCKIEQVFRGITS